MKLRVLALTATLAATAALSACGGSSDNSSTTTTTSASGGDAGAAALVPEAVKKKGELTIAADASYAPNEFIGKDGKTVEGMDADLAAAIGKVLGLKVKMVNASFDGILPGLSAGKYDLGMSSFTDTKEREKTVNFVTYFSAGTSFFVRSEDGPEIKTLADLCGHKVAVEKGTTQQDDSLAQSKKCVKEGKKGVVVSVFPDQNGANLALSTGRADVGMADSPVAAYQVKQSGGKFKLSGEPYGTAPYGIAISKGSGLEKSILAAVRVLMDNGEYKTILSRWGIADGAISDPKINGAID